MKHFLIFALPRSRTAWLSCLFTTRRVFCHHDALRRAPEPPKLSRLLASPINRGFVGDCDNGIALFADAVLNEFPDAPVAVIQRDPADVCASLDAFHERDDIPPAAIPRTVHLLQLGLDKVAASGRMTHHLTYESLNSVAALGRLWRSLVGEERFDEERARAMLSFNVQLQRDRYDAAISPAWSELSHAIVSGRKEVAWQHC